MGDTVRTESALLALVPDDGIFQGDSPLRIKRSKQVIAQTIRDIVVSIYDASTTPNLAIVSKSATYTAETADDLILVTSGTFTITLYAASGNTGRQIRIKNLNTGTVTVDGNASETIDGNATFAISTQYQSNTFACDGSNWHII